MSSKPPNKKNKIKISKDVDHMNFNPGGIWMYQTSAMKDFLVNKPYTLRTDIIYNE